MNKKIKTEKSFEKDYSTFQNVWYSMKNAHDWQKGFLLVNALYSISAAIIQLIIIALPKFVIDTIMNKSDALELMKVILILSVIQLVVLIMNDLCSKQFLWRNAQMQMKYIAIRMKKAFTMDYENLENPEILNYMERASRTTNAKYRGMLGIYNNFNMLTKNSLTLLISAIAILVLNPIIILVMVVLSYACYLVLNRAKVIDKLKHWDIMSSKYRKIYYLDHMTKNFGFAKDIRLFHMKDWLHDKQLEVHEEAHHYFADHYIRWIWYAAFMQLFMFIQEIVLYAWLVYCVLNRGMSIGNFTLYLGLVRAFSASAVQFFDTLTTMKRLSMETNDYRTFVEYPDIQEESKHKKEEKDYQETDYYGLQELKDYEFTFDHVYFRYPGQTEFILKGINIEIKAGKKLAIVGLNGAGKTTFIKLLLRLYEPTEGRILLNGTDIKNYDKKEYYKLFSPVFQNVECFAFPIKDNVSMKEPDNTLISLVKNCITRVGLEEKVKGFDKGINTELLKILHKDGIDLSGGEKQKLALARALYKNAQVIVLDEPTAALDPLAEYKLYKDFDELISGKTAVYISHRLSSTRFCDVIAMFSEGMIIEYGSHEDLLLNKDGSYAELFEVQAHYYKDKEEAVS